MPKSRLIPRLLWFVAAGLTLATVAGFLGAFWWGFELLDHLRWHYVIGLVVVLIGLLVGGQRAGVVLLLPLGINAGLLAPLLLPAPAVADSGFTLLHINLDKDKLAGLDAAAASEADLVLLQELTPALADLLPVHLPAYRLLIGEPLWNTHGSAILLREGSDLTMISAESHHLPSTATRPLLATTLDYRGTRIDLLSLHTTRARNAATSAGQSAEFAAVAAWSRATQAAGNQVLIVGDFNSTPWSGRVRRLLREGDLQSGMRGQGYQPSWPSALPKALQIPIDLIVHSPQLQVDQLRTGAGVGSDHLPLSASIFVPHLNVAESKQPTATAGK